MQRKAASPADRRRGTACGYGSRWRNRSIGLAVALKSGAGDEVIMSIAGHVSRAMLSRYSHVRMEAKRRALDEIGARQRAADEKRKEESEGREQDAMASQAVVVQCQPLGDGSIAAARSSFQSKGTAAAHFTNQEWLRSPRYGSQRT